MSFNFAGPSPVIYSGKVLGFRDQPIAGAAITLAGRSGISTTTDLDGKFKLLLPVRDSTAILAVAMTGYQPAYLPINDISVDASANGVIHIQPQSDNLNEVVITGYGAKRKETLAGINSDKDERLDSLWKTATPAIGRQAYQAYLRSAVAKMGLDTAIHGTESISFAVSRTGEISSYRIEESLSPAHDAALIRLVGEGPGWRLRKGRSARARVTINF